MTGAVGPARPGQDALAFQPAARLRERVLPGDLHAPVEKQQALGGQPRRHRVHRVDEAPSIARDGVGADHRHHVLRGLQMAVIEEQDEVTGCQVPVGGEQHRDVDYPISEGGDTLLLGVERQKAGEPQPIQGAQPWQAVGPAWALRGAAENQLAGDAAQVADSRQAQAPGGGAGDYYAVLVLGRGRSQDLDMPPGERARQRPPDRGGVPHRDSRVRFEAGQRCPEVLRYHVHPALLEGWLDKLPRAEIEFAPNRDTRLLDSQPVDRRQQLALREVERGHHNGAPMSAATVRRCCRTRLAGGEQCKHQATRQDCGGPDAACAPLRHGVTFFAAPARRSRRSPAHPTAGWR